MADETPDNLTPDDAAEASRDAPADLRQAEAAMESVEEAAGAVRAAAESAAGPEDAAAPLIDLPDLGAAGLSAELPAGISLLGDVALRVKVELGRTRMYVEDVLRLNAEAVIELDKAAGDPVDIYVNDRHVARGEVLVLNESFCVRVSEIITGGGKTED